MRGIKTKIICHNTHYKTTLLNTKINNITIIYVKKKNCNFYNYIFVILISKLIKVEYESSTNSDDEELFCLE